MTEKSLHQIMNDMVKRMDALRPEDDSYAAPEILTELEAFMRMDDLLSSLNREYLDAKNHRRELTSMFGADDAMSEVAIDMEDSAWCAMQTRYMELRQDRQLMEEVQRLMRRSEADAAEFKAREIAKEKEKQIQDFMYLMQVSEKVKRQNKTPAIFEWAILLLLFKIPPFDQKKQNFMPTAAAA